MDTPFAFGNGNALCEFVQFHLTGPGVDFATDLGGGDIEYEQHTVTLQPGATYTMQDDGRAGQTRRTFTVATSGTPTAPATPATSTTTTANPKGTPSKDPIGSAIGPFRGALQAAVSKTGKVTLKKGKLSVSSLKYGRYAIKVADGSKKAGFALQGVKTVATIVSTSKYQGSRTVTVNLTPGQWYFYSPSGTRHPFIVTR